MRRFLLFSVCATAAIATFACDEKMSVAAQTPSSSEEASTSGGATDSDGPGSTDAETPPKNPERHDVYPRSDESNSRSEGEDEPNDQGTDLTGVVNLNDATVETLQKLPGVGPVTAGKIDDYRSKRRFEETEDLKRIDGIGDVTYRKLKSHLTVEGDTTLASNSRAE